jgi:hypothetical protein
VPRASFAALLALAMASCLSACRHPTGEQCEVLCWRYNELQYWERFEVDARARTPDARAALRAEREKTWSEMRARTFDPGLENCVRACRRSAPPDAPACIEQSRTKAQADRCLD